MAPLAVHDKIWVCRSGSAADTQAVSDYVKFFLSVHAVELGDTPEVKTAANLFRSVPPPRSPTDPRPDPFAAISAIKIRMA